MSTPDAPPATQPLPPAAAGTSPRRARTLRHDLRAVWVDGLAWSAMQGMGEQAIVAFAVALEIAVPWAGLVATLPMVAGAVLQTVSPRAIRALGSHRRWVVVTAAVQALSFAPLVAGALAGALPAWALYATATVYWGAGFATNPAWSTWVGTLVPARVRIRYFARRTRWLHVMQISALLAAGWILSAGAQGGAPLRAFALVFLFATLARTLSVACLARQSEPDPMPGGLCDVPLRELARRLRHGPDGRLLGYMLAVHFATNVSAPFYTPYMLRELEFTYAEVMSLYAAAVLAKFAALPAHARLAERRGIRSLLWIGGLGVGPSVGLWLLTDDFTLLLAAQLLAGFVWSAWELATFLLFFDAIPPGERTSVLTTYHLAYAIAVACGSLLGGAVLRGLGGAGAAFTAVLAASFALRLVTVVLLPRVAADPGAGSRA